MLSRVSVYTNKNDIYGSDAYRDADVFLTVFSKLSLDDSSRTGGCVRMYYTSVFTMLACLMMKTVYLVSVTGFSGHGRGFLRVYSRD